MSKSIDFIESDSDQHSCQQGLLSLGLDFYHNTMSVVTNFGTTVTEHITDFGNDLREQAVDLSQTLDETLVSLQERGGDAINRIDRSIHRAMRPEPTSVVDHSVQVISDYLEDGSTFVSIKLRDLGHRLPNL